MGASTLMYNRFSPNLFVPYSIVKDFCVSSMYLVESATDSTLQRLWTRVDVCIVWGRIVDFSLHVAN
jgi:hypothetical protein